MRNDQNLTSKHPWHKPVLIAFSLLVLMALIPTVIIFAARAEPDATITEPSTNLTAPNTDSTEPPVEKLSIANIPGAVSTVDDVLFLTGEARICPSPFVKSTEDGLQLANTIKTQYSAVSGKVLDYTSVFVPDGEDYYRIYQFTVEIQEVFSENGGADLNEKQIIDVIYSCRYIKQTLIIQHENGEETVEVRYRAATPYYYAEDRSYCIDMGFTTALVCYDQAQYLGFFQLEAVEGHELTLQGKTYSLSDYADYDMVGGLYYDESVDVIAVPVVLVSFHTETIRETPSDNTQDTAEGSAE